ncbi:MAG: hypothetical protein ACOY30_05265 [Bacillota bacterium]
MTATVLILLAVIGIFIAVIIYFKGRKSILASVVGIMSIMLAVAGFNGYKDIKRDANIYYPLAIQWLEDKSKNNSGIVSKTEGNTPTAAKDDFSRNYSIYCIYYMSDNSRAVVYVELPSAQNDLVMAFNRSNRSLEEVHYIPKKMKPEQNLLNKLEPGIFFY